ncbi:hypothetical protein GcM3_033010 [Golovinomyces cichoracearum]|uniref:Uncharacterized protein n=1 Tax=Golovinomyces cichoracearum TaxID=62708 RepID=A0A420J4B9_9PEZI|nr:hypothetical protein GcM3_033010 [Golovinomyces cichoracearum]
MTPKNLFLPSLEQCISLTDEQCHFIMKLRDPENIRVQKNWERAYQPELIRQYMTMRSFTQIAQIMRPRLEWSYKTYANRYRDWLFPVDRVEREIAIIGLYNLVAEMKNMQGQNLNMCPSESLFSGQMRLPSHYLKSQGTVNLAPELIHPYCSIENPQASFFDVHQLCDDETIDKLNSKSFISETSTQRPTLERDTNSNLSILNLNYSAGNLRQLSNQFRPVLFGQGEKLYPQSQPSFIYQQVEPLKHDYRKGLWNSTLRVIPCYRDHTSSPWNRPFKQCTGCGFSQCHALMINARSIDINTFKKYVSVLRDHVKPDYAGNNPIAFLMVAGVSLEYFRSLLWDIHWSNFGQSSFSQSPLHVLNPQCLGDELGNLLKLFSDDDLTLRDSKCRTFLSYLFLQPLEPGSYIQVLQSFPNAIHYLQAFDTSGKRIIELMQEAATSMGVSFQSSREAILVGIDEIKHFLTTTSTNNSKSRSYGYPDIARGFNSNAEVVSFSSSTFECPICYTDAHSNSHYDQMLCACQHGGIDRNAPDEQGWTAAHLLVTNVRCSKSQRMRPETPAETAELFRLLIFSPNLREALHVIDPEGNSLVYNIATRGHSAILEYVLELEDEGRRCSMVNSFGRSKEGGERSVLESVEMAMSEYGWNLKKRSKLSERLERQSLTESYNALKKCRKILKQYGAKIQPSIKLQKRVY